MNARVDMLHEHGPGSSDNSSLRSVSLDDKYTATSGEIYLSGVQALVRLPLMQRLRDKAAGINTAGFISGYRGSPLGGLDEALWKAQPHLDANEVRFVPGVNEELAATAVWGSQQVHLLGESAYEGVFGLWYGKGPGVDRSIDVFKHMNHAGTSRFGGVLLVAGDDHGAYSSTLPHQSDHVFAASMIPVLYPCNVQEYIELGLHGWAMSRFSGCVVGFKALADTVESSASISADPFVVKTLIPREFELPEGGLNNKLSTDALGLQARKQEALMQDHKIYAAMAYARENRLNRITIDSTDARLGIVASGKSYLDVLEALEELGIDEALAAEIGIRVFKVSMPWPLEPEGIREFSTGLEEILVVEEKRQVVEYQLKEQLYNWREDVRPRVIGKFDERGEWDVSNSRGRGDWLLPAKGDFSVAQVARAIAARIRRLGLQTKTEDLIQARLEFLESKDLLLKRAVTTPARPAWYCSGCPHNSSTRVPEGSFALAGIGCHVMATSIYPEFNKLTTQMGGEGAPWIGAAAFSKVPHVFSNLGDGTYYHSGSLAVRAAVAANRVIPVNITYKVLYNDAVAMTGGQPVDGPIGVREIASQLSAEGVNHIAIVTEDLGRYTDRRGLPDLATLHDRGELDDVQRAMRERSGVGVIIYDQTCAAEKRRRRKKNEYPQATERVFINEAVCEGCGDCGSQSNCTAILPKDTEFGRKRVIDQSACNADYTCIKGFCPSFVSVQGAKPRRVSTSVSQGSRLDFADLPMPATPSLAQPVNILVTGVGGTGVITIGALLGMAAHLEHKGASVLDMTGMSQKNGAVTSHVRIASRAAQLRAQRIATGEADLVLACDMLTAGSPDAVAKMRPARTLALVNSHEQPAGQFARNPDWVYPGEDLRDLIRDATEGRAEFLDVTALATSLLGDAIGANLMLLGMAFQRGALPLSLESLLRAIEINGVAVSANVRAFQLGRLAAIDPQRVRRMAAPAQPVSVQRPMGLQQVLEHGKALLTAYQNSGYAAEYVDFIEKVRFAEKKAVGGDRLTIAVAANLAKLMAYKDEYEVARLHTTSQFKSQLNAAFEGPFRLSYHLAPPSLLGTSGAARKLRFGSWMGGVFSMLAKLKFLRGSVLDPFGRTEERRIERDLILEYRAHIERHLEGLGESNLELSLRVAKVPEVIRGFGHVKLASIKEAHVLWRSLSSQTPEFLPPLGKPSSTRSLS